jgi:hypothetical protein
LVRRIDALVTLQIGPEQILVAAKIHFTHDTTSTDIAAASIEAERRLIALNSAIRYVFLQPTEPRPRSEPGIRS